MLQNESTIKTLNDARRAWEAMAPLRAKRDRLMRFTFGDQWSDPATAPDGSRTTERELAIAQGKKPMTNNLIRRLVKCVVGRHRLQSDDNPPPDNLARAYAANDLAALDSRLLEEFLISGCAIQRVGRPEHDDEPQVVNVNPARFFVNRFADPRSTDIVRIGMVREMTMPQVIRHFADGDRAEALRLAKLFGDYNAAGFAGWPDTGETFLCADREAGKVPVVEVWTLESVERILCHDPLEAVIGQADGAAAPIIEAENSRRQAKKLPLITTRWELRSLWRGRWLAPDGTLLKVEEADNHPFVVKFYPLTDGDVHSLVEDVIDQQIYVNRLITLIDQIISVSAKGTLLYPIEALPDGYPVEQLARYWSRPGAVLPYISRGGRKPEQISSNSTNIGARELLQLEMKMFEDVSGVSDALMGRSSAGGNVGVERYESEVKNALVAIADILLSFDSFRSARDRLLQ